MPPIAITLPQCPLCNTASGTHSPASTPSTAQTGLGKTSRGCQPYHRDKNRDYWRCTTCYLIFVPPLYHLSFSQQKRLYDLHENHKEDEGYRRFLSRLATPILARIASKSHGLEFGCGPCPVLASMLENAGHTITLFDPLYANNPEALQQQYDFITATEVIEHLCEPARDLDTLWRCLKPGGTLGLMTKLVRNHHAFTKWHYIRDPTHVSFFSPETFQWLANTWHANYEIIGADVILFYKKAPCTT